MLEFIIRIIRSQTFLPSFWGVITNPLFIIRRGLYREISRLAPSFQGEILDFGCGSKPYRTLFSNVKIYTGVDVETSGHNHESSKVDIYYNGQTLPFSDSSLDAVVSFEVFEHVFNLDDILKEICRVLKSNGTLLFSIPFAWEEHEAPYDYARYTSFGIKSILQKHGFYVMREIKTTNYIQGIGQLFIAYLYQHLFPDNRYLRFVLQILIIFPLTSLTLFLAAIFPARFEMYSNLVIVCKKIK